jgi:hypothetical protein
MTKIFFLKSILFSCLYFTITSGDDHEQQQNRVDMQNLCYPCGYPSTFQTQQQTTSSGSVGQPRWLIGSPNTMGNTVQPKPFPNQVHHQPSNSQGMQPIQPLAFQHNQGNNVARQNNNSQARQDIPVDNTPVTQNMVEKLNEAVNETRGNEEKALMEDIVKIYESSGGTRVQKWDQVSRIFGQFVT